MEIAARVVEIIGGTMTLLGLLQVYLRTKHGPDYLDRAVDWLLRRSRGGTAHGTAGTTVVAGLEGEATIDFKLDPTASVDARFGHVAKVIRELQYELVDARQKARANTREIELVRRYATDAAERARQKADNALQDFGKRLDKTAVIDLRLAIWGVAVSTVGVIMGFWA
jgi:hypothetical protein